MPKCLKGFDFGQFRQLTLELLAALGKSNCSLTWKLFKIFWWFFLLALRRAIIALCATCVSWKKTHTKITFCKCVMESAQQMSNDFHKQSTQVHNAWKNRRNLKTAYLLRCITYLNLYSFTVFLPRTKTEISHYSPALKKVDIALLWKSGAILDLPCPSFCHSLSLSLSLSLSFRHNSVFIQYLENE